MIYLIQGAQDHVGRVHANPPCHVRVPLISRKGDDVMERSSLVGTPPPCGLEWNGMGGPDIAAGPTAEMVMSERVPMAAILSTLAQK